MPVVVRSAPPVPRLRLPSVAIEHALFVLGVGLFVGCVWGGVRTTGLGLLLALTALATWGRTLDRTTAVRRLAVLGIALLAATVLRELTTGPLAHRGGRFALSVGFAAYVLVSVPARVARWLAELGQRIDADPFGRAARLTAVFGVTLPVAVFQGFTVDHVGAGDTMPVVPTVARMLSAGSRDLSPLIDASPRWAVYGPGRPYFLTADGLSMYPAGMEVFAAPGVLVATVLGFDPTADAVHVWVEKLTAAAVSGTALGLFFLLALRTGSAAAVGTVTALLATGSVFTSTVGMLLWQQGGVIVGMLAALLLADRGRLGWAGIVCGLMLGCRPSAATFLLPFAGWAVVRFGRRGLWVPIAAAVGYAPFALLYAHLYGTPVGPSAGQLAVRWVPLENLPGVLLSPGRGLFVYQPLLLLLALRLLPAFRTALPAGWSALVLVTVGCHLAVVGSWPVWWGGACYGSRLAAETVPLLALLVVGPVGVLLHRGGWPLLLAVGVLGLFLHTGCVFYDGWVWNVVPTNVDQHPGRLWDWSRPPFLFHLLPPS